MSAHFYPGNKVFLTWHNNEILFLQALLIRQDHVDRERLTVLFSIS